MPRTTTLKMGSMAPAGRMRSEAEQPPVSDAAYDELADSVNEVAERVRDTLSMIFFDIG